MSKGHLDALLAQSMSICVMTCYFLLFYLYVPCLQEEERMVKQFHYISWYDHRAADPTSFLEYLRKVKDFAVPSTGPVLAHCR